MTNTISKHHRNLSAAIHGATFSRFFIPFGNFIISLVLWSANKKDSEFVDYNGKQALNFQICILLYAIISGIISVPFFIGFLPYFFEFSFDNLNSFNNFNININSNDFKLGWWFPIGIAGLAQVALFILNLVYTILATLRTNEGQIFEYPFTIKFIK